MHAELIIIYRENPSFEEVIKVTNEPSCHVLVMCQQVTQWSMSHLWWRPFPLDSLFISLSRVVVVPLDQD